MEFPILFYIVKVRTAPSGIKLELISHVILCAADGAKSNYLETLEGDEGHSYSIN